jgi:hypothetical protein
LNQEKSKCNSNPNIIKPSSRKISLCSDLSTEAIKQVAIEIVQAQTAVSQVQSSILAQKSEGSEY